MKKILLAAAAVALLATPALAHRQWLMPSATVFSGEGLWVAVDAAVSNDLFYFEHNPMNIDNLKIVMPDGSEGKAQNVGKGKYRNVFDVELTQAGTYRIASVNEGGMLFANYKQNGERKRWRGKASEMAAAIPADATELSISENSGRVETFVTSGKPSDKTLKPKGKGLEFVPVTHPNSLVAGEAARFRFLLDGKAAADLEVTVTPGGIRYRDSLNEINVKTDKDGYFSVTFPEPGYYYLAASIQDDKASVKNAKRRASYAATLEAAAP